MPGERGGNACDAQPQLQHDAHAAKQIIIQNISLQSFQKWQQWSSAIGRGYKRKRAAPGQQSQPQAADAPA